MKQGKHGRSRRSRPLARTLLALVALPVLAACVLVAVNWRDAAPSPAALRMQAMLDGRPVVADADNAYIDALGFGAPVGADVRTLGLERRARLQGLAAADGQSDPLAYPQPDLDLKSLMPAAWTELAKACSRVGQTCRSALERHDALADRSEANADTLARYAAMLSRPGWREDIEADPRAPSPVYGGLLHAQRISMATLWLAAPERDAALTVDALDTDLRFWRRVLASSDLLITKLIAAAAVRQHFEWAPMVLARVPAGPMGHTLPGALTRPITTDERSLGRALAGEWQWGQRTMEQAFRNDRIAAMSVPAVAGRLEGVVGKRLFKPQDTANRNAAALAGTVALSQATYRAIGAHGKQTAARPDPGPRWIQFFYNPVGRMLVDVAAPVYDDYVVRVADLEGMRRAALASIELKRGSTPPGEMALALARASWASPYDNAPLQWDAANSCVRFAGKDPSTGKQACLLH